MRPRAYVDVAIVPLDDLLGVAVFEMVEHGTAVRVLVFAKHGSFIYGTSRWRHLEFGRLIQP